MNRPHDNVCPGIKRRQRATILAGRRRAAMLLEVVISVGLLVFAMAVVGGRIQSSLATVYTAQNSTKAVMLADSTVSLLQAGSLVPDTDGVETGYYGINCECREMVCEDGCIELAAPGYTWRMRVEPTDTDNLFMILLDIGYNEDMVEAQIENPSQAIEFDDPGRITVHTVYRLLETPADLNLSRDFGIDLEKLQELQSQMPELPAGGAEGAEGDGEGGGDEALPSDPAELLSMVMEFVAAHPEILSDGGGINMAAVAQLPSEDFALAMQILQQFTGRGQGLEDLEQQLADNPLGTQGGNNDRPGTGRDRGEDQEPGIGGNNRTPGGNRGDRDDGRGRGRR